MDEKTEEQKDKKDDRKGGSQKSTKAEKLKG